MGKITRQCDVILHYLVQNKEMDLLCAKQLLSVSESTVRRLFTLLEQEGKVVRYYGGVKLVAECPPDYAYELVEVQCVEEKTHCNSRSGFGRRERCAVFG